MNKSELKFFIRFLKNNGVYCDFLKNAKKRNLRYNISEMKPYFAAKNISKFLYEMMPTDVIMYALDWNDTDAGARRWSELYGEFRNSYNRCF